MRPDRKIPFYNIILRCDVYAPAETALPQGFSLRSFRRGDERGWAGLELEIGDFSTLGEAEEYFVRTYCQDMAAVEERCVVAVEPGGQVVGSCIAWKDRRGAAEAASLHWLVVSPKYQRRRLGRALVRKTMEIFHAHGEFPVYLHTQPWSYPALLLYVQEGFSLQRRDTFSHYQNEYEQAMAVLKTVLTETEYAHLLSASSR
ncbi:GNAT family N-acetyltransferase [Dysosmobacter sp.]